MYPKGTYWLDLVDYPCISLEMHEQGLEELDKVSSEKDFWTAVLTVLICDPDPQENG